MVCNFRSMEFIKSTGGEGECADLHLLQVDVKASMNYNESK